MRVELVELLRERQICHPSRIVQIESKCNSEVRIEVVGFPWWLKGRHDVADAKITFHIVGITDGSIDSEAFDGDPFEEDLEYLDVRPLAEHEWAKGVDCEVYCSSPLSNPFDIFAKVHDFLSSVECPYSPERYLNLGNSGSLSEFATIAASQSFLLCRGPQLVCRIVCDALEKSGAPYNLIRGLDLSRNSICFRIGGSHLICRSVYAEYDD